MYTIKPAINQATKFNAEMLTATHIEDDGFTMVSAEEVKDWSQWCQAPPAPDDAEAELLRFFKSYTTETSSQDPASESDVQELSDITVLVECTEKKYAKKISETPTVQSTELGSAGPSRPVSRTRIVV